LGFKNGETLATSGVTGTPSLTTLATATSPVPGPYPITAALGTLAAGNYSFALVNGSLSITKATLTVTANDTSRVYGSPNPTFTASYSGFKNGETLPTSGVTGSPNLTTTATPSSPVPGPYTITAALGMLAANNYAFVFVNGNLTITTAALTITANAQSKQYSDPLPSLTATYAGFVLGEGPGNLTGTLLCTTPATALSGPPSYPITCSGQTSTNYAITYYGGVLTVTQEDARTNYTGAMYVSTSCTTCSTATVTLAATVQDITAVLGDPFYDAYPGDIRKATLTFVNRDASNSVLCTAPIGLVSLSDTMTGTATCSWLASIGSANSMQFTVGIVVGGYYTRNSSLDDTVVTVSQPLSNFITGGGYLAMSSSAGLYPGAPGTKNNFGFNVKYNKSGTNLQGNINTIIRNGGRVYQVKGNSMTSLAENPSSCTNASPTPPCMATFNGKANIQDITDPNSSISIDGNATLQVTMTDNGEPGSSDTIGITVWNKSGGLWFSSNWTGTKTVEQLLGGGNLVVH